MISPSLVCNPSIGSKLAAFLPASVVNVALVFSFIAMQPAWDFPTDQMDAFAFALNTVGDLFFSIKPKEVLTQVSPTPTIKVLPTSTLQYQPESTSSVLYAVALFALTLVGAVFIILRNNTDNLPPPSSVNSPFYIGSERETCDNGCSLDGDLPEDVGVVSNEGPVTPSDDPIDSSNAGTESDFTVSGNKTIKFIGDIGGSPPPPPPPPSTTSGMEDDSSKNARRVLAGLKTFLIIFAILTTFTHGGRITQKIRSFAIQHDDFTFSNSTSVTPYFRHVLELVTTTSSHFPVILTRGNTLAPEIAEKLSTVVLASSIHSTIPRARSNKFPSELSEILSPSILRSLFSSGSNEGYDSISFPVPTKDVMTSIPMSVYPIGLSLLAVKLSTPTTPSSSKVALTLEYIKLLTFFLIFCIVVPILSLVVTILPTVIQFSQLWISRSPETFTYAMNDEAMKFNVNEVDLMIEVVENNKVDINIIHNKVVPIVSTFMNKGKGKALEAIEEKDETATCPFASKDSVDLATPELSTHTLVDVPRQTRAQTRRPHPPCHVRNANKRMRKADKAVIEAALQAGAFP